MSRLEGRSVVVTGAAGGLGAPLARLLRLEGAHVTGIDRVACPTADETTLCDLGDPVALAELAGSLAAAPPDILVNLAGVMRFGLHESLSQADIALCYHLNLTVPSVLAQAVAGPMRTRGAGQIVNIGSMLGAIPYPWFAAYSASKAGLAALSQSLRRELAGSGVAVTHVSPRAARTAFNEGPVERFLAVTGMKADPPGRVAETIIDAIARRRETVSVGWMEKLYAAVNAIAPRLIDSGIAPQVRRARAEFC